MSTRALTLQQARSFADIILCYREDWQEPLTAVAIMNKGDRYNCATSDEEFNRAIKSGWSKVEVRRRTLK